MKPYIIIHSLLVLSASMLTFYLVSDDDQIHQSRLLKDFQKKINSVDPAVKTVINTRESYVCWLSELGELHSISGDTSNHQSFDQLQEAWADVTFIEDFCLNPTNDSIYFTDIMDLSSGLSAIKVSDRQGGGLQTLAYLPEETPYRLCLSPSGKVLFYLAKQETANEKYALRFIQLKNGNIGTMYTSAYKIDSLRVNTGLQQLTLTDPNQGTIAFDTDRRSVFTLAEARNTSY